MRFKIKQITCLGILMIPILSFAQTTSAALSAQEKTKIYFDNKNNPNTFKILSYNTYEGFRKDSTYIKEFQKWIAERSPDVVAFQELKGFSKDQLVALAKSAGFGYTVLQKRVGFPLAIMSKYPITNVKKIMDGMTHGLLYCKILDYNIIVTHLDPKTYQQREVEVDSVLKYVNLIPKTEKIVLMGDFNNMSPQDRKDYDNATKMKLVLNSEKNHPETKVTNNGLIAYTAIQKLIDAKLYDTWKLFNHNYEKSAPTQLRTHGNYTRIDYIWVNDALKSNCIDATLVKDDLTAVLSDHYPMLLILKK